MSRNLDLKSSQLKLILETGKHLLVEPDIGKILQISIDSIIEISKAERGLIILFEKRGKIIFETARNLDQEDIKNPKFEVSRTIIKKVREEGKAVFKKNAHEDPEFSLSKSTFRLRILSVIALPLKKDDEIFGVIYLDNRSIRGIFENEIFELVAEFCDYISLAAYSALEKKKLENKVSTLESELRTKYQLDAIIGHDPKILKVLDLVTKVAITNANILIHGESGTGKELVARAIHYNSKRKDKKILPINCAALPENLLESELFGHEKGAFTGATNNREGIFEYADGGTMFLDEISEMSLPMQAKLLRILQSGEYTTVGGTEVKQSDVRLVSASSKNIKNLVSKDLFREDLYYRINVIHLDLPPLRERRSDILILINHFLKIYQKQSGKEKLQLSRESEACLLNYDYPGNVRELENIVQRAVILTKGDLIEKDLLFEDLPLMAKITSASI